MKWTAPPDRREITLVLFSLTVFILSYNLDISLRLLGLDPSTQRAIFNTLGLGELTVIEKDGRKPLAWRDSLENTISGDWRWDEKHVAGSGAERSQEKGIGRYGAQWLGRSETGEVSGEVFGEKSVNDGIVHWDMIPRSTVLQHTPGTSV
jgi:hypothetical protein